MKFTFFFSVIVSLMFGSLNVFGHAGTVDANNCHYQNYSSAKEALKKCFELQKTVDWSSDLYLGVRNICIDMAQLIKNYVPKEKVEMAIGDKFHCHR